MAAARASSQQVPACAKRALAPHPHSLELARVRDPPPHPRADLVGASARGRAEPSTALAADGLCLVGAPGCAAEAGVDGASGPALS